MYRLWGYFSQELQTVVSDDGLGDGNADLDDEQFLERVRGLVVRHVSTPAHQPRQHISHVNC